MAFGERLQEVRRRAGLTQEQFAAELNVSRQAVSKLLLGQTARVTESIDNAVPTGAVYVGGMTWTARSESGQLIPRNAQVKIVRMEGVRLFVEPV